MLLAIPAWCKPYPVAARMNVAYGPRAEQIGDFYAPDGVTAAKPVVVMIHGGGWISGSRGVVGKLAEVLAGSGIAVFNIDYRLAAEGRPDTRWPAQLVDVQLAVRFLRSHAAEFAIEPAHIGAMGDSAGGQLSMLLGELHTIVPSGGHDGDGHDLYPDQRPDVSVVVDEFGPTDVPGMGIDAAENIKLLFGTATPSKAAADSASPLSFITAQTAPTYIIHGRLDAVVPFVQSQRLDAALQAHGIPHEFMTFEGGHGYLGINLKDVASLQLSAFKWLLHWLQ